MILGSRPCTSFFTASFILYVVMANYKYTFFDTRTGSQFNVNNYITARTTSRKYDVFTKHPSYWRGRIGDDVRAWTMANYANWEELDPRPDWWNDDTKSMMEDHFIPPQFVAAMDKATKGGKRERRKSSILEGIIVDGGIALAVQLEVATIVQRRNSGGDNNKKKSLSGNGSYSAV